METRCCEKVAGCVARGPGEIGAMLGAGACQLVDVRGYAEFAAGHIAGSRLMPLDSLETGGPRLDPGCEVLLICRSGRRSREAARRLSAMGFNKVTVLDGGIEAWKRAGMPLERLPSAPWAIDRQMRLVAGIMVVLGAALAQFVHPGWIWLSGGVGLGLAHAAITDSCMMGNLMALLPWNRIQGSQR